MDQRTSEASKSKKNRKHLKRFCISLTDALHPCTPAQQDIGGRERSDGDRYVAGALESTLGDAEVATAIY